MPLPQTAETFPASSPQRSLLVSRPFHRPSTRLSTRGVGCLALLPKSAAKSAILSLTLPYTASFAPLSLSHHETGTTVTVTAEEMLRVHGLRLRFRDRVEALFRPVPGRVAAGGLPGERPRWDAFALPRQGEPRTGSSLPPSPPLRGVQERKRHSPCMIQTAEARRRALSAVPPPGVKDMTRARRERRAKPPAREHEP